MLTVRDGVSLIRHRSSRPSRLRSRRRSSAPVNSRACRPAAAAASTLRRRVVDEHGGRRVQPVPLDQQREERRVGLGHPLDTGDHDVLEQAEEVEGRLGVRVGLGRPVGQGQQPGAPACSSRSSSTVPGTGPVIVSGNRAG